MIRSTHWGHAVSTKCDDAVSCCFRSVHVGGRCIEPHTDAILLCPLSVFRLLPKWESKSVRLGTVHSTWLSGLVWWCPTCVYCSSVKCTMQWTAFVAIRLRVCWGVCCRWFKQSMRTSDRFPICKPSYRHLLSYVMCRVDVDMFVINVYIKFPTQIIQKCLKDLLLLTPLQ